MIKKILLSIALIAVAAVLIFGAIQRTGHATNVQIGASEYQSQGTGRRNGANNNADHENNAAAGSIVQPLTDAETHTDEETHLDLTNITDVQLTQVEIDGLIYLREEEKLARDVYLTMYDLWGQNTFQNIAGSEQTHTDSILALLNAYRISDPVAGKEIGEFTNPELQALFDKLVAQGSQSLVDALSVGAAIEEIDILDLKERSSQTSVEDILKVYASLETGSNNHLRAFTQVFERRSGYAYQPQYLSSAEYQGILSEMNGSH